MSECCFFDKGHQGLPTKKSVSFSTGLWFEIYIAHMSCSCFYISWRWCRFSISSTPGWELHRVLTSFTRTGLVKQALGSLSFGKGRSLLKDLQLNLMVPLRNQGVCWWKWRVSWLGCEEHCVLWFMKSVTVTQPRVKIDLKENFGWDLAKEIQ